MSSRVAPSDLAAEELRVGSVCFSFGFTDKTMRVPIITTYVYVGSEFEDGVQSFLFRDVNSQFGNEADGIDIIAFKGVTGVWNLEEIINQLNILLTDWTSDNPTV